MGETLATWSPSCNGSVNVQLSGDATTSDAGTLLLREALDRSGVIEAMEDHLVDPRDPLRIRSFAGQPAQLRAIVLQRAMGWYNLNDTGTLQQDPVWQLACSGARGLTPLGQARPSQATLSRLLGCLGSDDNIDIVHEGLLRLAIWRYRSLSPAHQPRQVTLDIDGLPIEVFGHQGGSAYQRSRQDTHLLAADRLTGRKWRHGRRAAARGECRAGGRRRHLDSPSGAAPVRGHEPGRSFPPPQVSRMTRLGLAHSK